MKRVADKQLSRDEEDSQDSESPPSQGIQRASDAVLAGRKIKPLPSRAGRTVDQPKPIFGGSNPSVPSASPAVDSSATPGTSILSTTPAKPVGADTDLLKSSSATSTYTSVTSLPSPATNTSRAFASILNTQSTDFFNNSTHLSFGTTTPPPASNKTSDSRLVFYYSNLRGLNVCLLDFIKNAVETDSFVDLTSILESYQSLRSAVQKEYAGPSTKDIHSASEFTTKPSQPGPTLFGSKQPLINPTTSEFNIFGSSAVNPFMPPKAPGSAESTIPTTPSSTNIFGTSPASSGFLFGATGATTPAFGSSGFAFGLPAASSQSTTGTSTPNVLPFPIAASTLSPSPSSNHVGSPVNSFNPLTSSSSEPTPKTAFGNWSNTSMLDKKSTTITFGSAAAAAKNTPVSHPFATSPGGSSTSTSTTPAPLGSEKGSQDTGETSSETATRGTEPTLGLLTPNPHDQEGIGEENEETIHAVKLKAYRMRKVDEQQGGSGWAELGMGILRLKKDGTTGARRVLLRNSTTGKININFKVYSGLKPSITKKALTFIGHSDGVSQTYCVRLPDETQAEELKGVLEREIEFVKATETS